MENPNDNFFFNVFQKSPAVKHVGKGNRSYTGFEIQDGNCHPEHFSGEEPVDYYDITLRIAISDIDVMGLFDIKDIIEIELRRAFHRAFDYEHED